MGRQVRQVATAPEQVAQGEVQAVQTWVTAMYPLAQLGTHLKLSKLRVLQLVQLSAATSQVLQSPAQITAMPLMLT